MATIEKFEDIQAWQKAREVASAIYKISKKGELAKDFGVRDQIRRSAVSVQSNIAEGFGRDGNKDFVRFLRIAKGSSSEFRTSCITFWMQNTYTSQLSVVFTICLPIMSGSSVALLII